MKKPYQLQNKQENYEYGRIINKMFLAKNHIDWVEPELIKKYENITGNPSNNVYRGQFYGRRESVKICVNLSKCLNPVSNPGFSWSYTGSRADITPAGVLSHEVGHYVDFKHGWYLGHDLNKVKGKAVSSYEPNFHEVFAETMRLFILNPDLLRAGNKVRYDFIVNLGIKPVIRQPWEKVLENAHPKLINSVVSWINKK